MNDRIKSAFRKGLEASEKSDQFRLEAEGIIAEFARDIAAESENKITITLEETWVAASQRVMSAIAASVLGPLADERKKTHGIFAQVVVGNASSSRLMLCTVTFGPGTYPIELAWESEARICHNGNELHMALVSLAEDPRTGKRFRQLIASYPEIAKVAAKGTSSDEA